MNEAPARILLLHHVGSGNLGDDATLDMVMRDIRLRQPDVAFTALTMNPADSSRRHNIPCDRIGRYTWTFGRVLLQRKITLKERARSAASRSKILFSMLRAIYRAVIWRPKECMQELWFLASAMHLTGTAEMFIVTGGGQLTERDGPWAFPYSIFKWVLLAKLRGRRTVILNIGLGPLTQGLSKFFAAQALNLADYVSFRDEYSRALAESIGFRGEGRVFPDCAYSLASSLPAFVKSSEKRRKVVGIAPLPYADPRLSWTIKDRSAYDRYLHELESFTTSLNSESYSAELFCTDIGVDPLAIEDLETAICRNGDVPEVKVRSVGGVRELLETMAGMDFIVTCRFHGVVFASLLQKPVLAISPHPKVTTLMADLGLSDYCLDIDTFNAALLGDKLSLLASNADDIRERMAEMSARYRVLLATQFDALFSPNELFTNQSFPAMQKPKPAAGLAH